MIRVIVILVCLRTGDQVLLRIAWWMLVLIFGISATVIGLLLPLVPGLPFLFVVSLALDNLCPRWWHCQWLYREWLKLAAKLKLKWHQMLSHV